MDERHRKPQLEVGLIRLLDNVEREQLREVFREEFDSALPDANQANILVYEEDGRILGFITAEMLIRAGMIWVEPTKRGSAAAKIVKALAQYLEANIPHGSSVVTIGDEKYDGLFTKLGMRKIDGQVYRKDF